MTGFLSRLGIICSDLYLVLTSAKATRFETPNYGPFATGHMSRIEHSTLTVVTASRAKPMNYSKG
jgi:hypothetical protein